MDRKTIEAAPPQKKPYLQPQLHELAGSDGAGKVRYTTEIGGGFGPS
jgi:hypothetical protein